MSYRKMTLEESVGEDRTLESNEEYVPGRGEAFAIGITNGWQSANKVMPFVIIALILIFAFVCN
jgi:hypothetical protein